MGNVEHKSKRQSAAANDRRGSFGRLFRRVFRGRQLPRNPVDGQGSLVPCTNHNGECPVCCEPNDVLLRFSVCSHMACMTCWLTFVCTEIEGFAMGCVTCIGCKERLAASTVIRMLTDACKEPSAFGTNNIPSGSTGLRITFHRALLRYEEFLLRQALSREPDMRWCPSGCGYGLIAHGFQACPQLVCPRPECYGRSFCYNCQRPWSIPEDQPTSADDTPRHVCTINRENRNDTIDGIIAFLGLRQMRRFGSVAPEYPTSSRPRDSVDAPDARRFVDEQQSGSGSPLGSLLRPTSSDDPDDEGIRRVSNASQSSVIEGEVKPCPNCKSLIQKLNDGTCNSMSCSVCSTEFCWLCLKPVGAEHFFNLTGCTAWGRQPLSRRSRVLILLSLMLGMPIIIPLGVALGVPLGMIALSVVACSTVNKYYKGNKHLRRFWVFCTLLSSLLWAPVCVALLNVFLVFICLGYTYVFLPVCVLSTVCKQSPTPLPMNPEQVANYTVSETSP